MCIRDRDYAYTIVDLGSRVKESLADEVRAIEGVLRVRLLNH